ncbi:hypothetical protein [Flammeovirga kamogawensis]|uniref:Uncharacterized protein n=1 Tax=Flammeovirga kamogawensis TaxID=373891 RepID=A0ABX8GYU9_9BACT|nr:hypothetical protein [Flammeovirga kamogawensis]MBB6459179.1 hypothetical protein [Flammeovirga kamogawensis]QWG08745.1 hypothetical protein KM029_07340 [Flammeovirga kamogawensis]TRX67038.1 hypothetical protein EO216_02385 [Flammeovirga kamogawensis]
MISEASFRNKLKELYTAKTSAELLIKTFRDGGIEVITPLILVDGSEHQLKTIIQLDADIINYIPDLSDTVLILNASKLKRALRRHWYEVEYCFFQLQTNQSFWNALSDALVVFINACVLIYAIDIADVVQSIISLGFASISVSLRRKIQEYLSPYLIRLGFKLYKLGQKFSSKWINAKKKEMVNSIK